MRESELLFIFFLAILSYGDLSFENLKSYMMSSCMTKLKFLSKPNTIHLDYENLCSFMLLALH
jgi:hypothetical protein